MIELTIKKYLDVHLDEPSFFEHQKDLPERYVIIEKTSSGSGNQLSLSTFAFQSYAESMLEAARLNIRVKKAVEGMVELGEISSVQLNADYNFTDTATKKYRYQAVFDITHY